MHLANFPALPPPQNVQAQELLAHASAPAIVFGSPHDNEHLEKARFEYKLRKLCHWRGWITNAELLQAKLRLVALLNEYAAAAYPPTPQSTIDTMRRLCTRLEEENYCDPEATAIRSDVASVRAALDHAERTLQPNATEPPVKKEKRRRS